MQRDSQSHKGENGKVAIIGGSKFMHGAPLLSALAAEECGVDLVYVCLPACHADVAKMTSLNFQVHPFDDDDLRTDDVEMILELLATMDAAVIGPGVAKEKKSIDALLALIDASPCPLVLDATALQPKTLTLVKGKTAVLTPHRGELERMGIAPGDCGKAAKDAGVTIVLKGPVDRIAGPDGKVQEISGGNAGLSVGGTGDALAGLIAGLMAQKMDPTDAAVMATTIIKRAAALLMPERGFAFGAEMVIGEIAHLVHTYEG